MSEEKKEKELQVIDTEAEEGGEQFHIVLCSEPDEQLFVAQESTAPEHLVLLHIKSKIGFAIPYGYAHELSHMIHEALEHLHGGDIDEQENPEIEKEPTLH